MNLQRHREEHAVVDSVWIVAGGPSARGIDLSKLHNIIAVNGAYQQIPHPERCVGVVSIDRDFIATNQEAIAQRGFASLLLARVGSEPIQAWAKCQHFDVAPKLSEDPCVAHTGGCSGAAALNVAYHMRPKFIGLIGFDYDASGRHWYECGARATNSKETWNRWAEHYDTTIGQLRGAGIKVVNFSPQSRITIFLRLPIDMIASWQLSRK